MRSVFALRRRREVRMEAPEAFQAGFLDDDHWKGLARAGLRLCLQPGELVQEPRHIAAADRMLGHLLAATWRQ